MFGDDAALLGRVLLYSGRDRRTHNDLPLVHCTGRERHCAWNKAYVVAQAGARLIIRLPVNRGELARKISAQLFADSRPRPQLETLSFA